MVDPGGGGAADRGTSISVSSIREGRDGAASHTDVP